MVATRRQWPMRHGFTRALRTRSRREGTEGEKAEAGNKPGSVIDNHSSGIAVTSYLERPTRESVRDRRCEQGSRTPLFGLAPGGVFHAANCYQSRGALLPHLFTLTDDDPKTAAGGIFSVALSIGSRLPGVTWRPVRRSPDFPPQRAAAIVWPTPAFSGASVLHFNCKNID